MRKILLLVVFIFVCSGCHRTVYKNISPTNVTQSVPEESVFEPDASWRSFFLYGWAPGEVSVKAYELCGGAEKIAELETRRTFLQGLVAQFAGYYVNIYSPYNGTVRCIRPPDASIAKVQQ